MAKDFLEPEDFASALRSDRKFLDVRSEGEFLEAAFEGVHNIPILSNDERHEVGLCYHQSGSEAAIQLGHRLVSGDVREKRLQAWIDFSSQEHPAALFCWRGGLRSETAQTWLKERGVEMPRVRGGYKAIRNFLLRSFEDLLGGLQLVLVCGKTGSGKTKFLQTLKSRELVIDLERLAKHRGSAFGEDFEPQPSQATFENNLILEILRMGPEVLNRKIFVEDESRAIGRVHIPVSFHARMQTSPFFEIEASLEERVSNILKDYVKEPFEKFESESNVNPVEMLRQILSERLTRIKDRLGGLRFTETMELLLKAFEKMKEGRDLSDHRLWIRKVLEYYYDPYYEKAIQKKAGARRSIFEEELRGR